MTSAMAVDGITSCLRLKEMHANVCETVKHLTGFLQCNGGKLEECVQIWFRRLLFVGIEIDKL